MAYDDLRQLTVKMFGFGNTKKNATFEATINNLRIEVGLV